MLYSPNVSVLCSFLALKPGDASLQTTINIKHWVTHAKYEG